MIELDLYSRLNNKFIFGPDLSLRTADGHQPNDLIISINFSFRRWDSPFEACWKLNDIRHCTTINVSLRDFFSPWSPSIWLHYSFKPKKVSLPDSFSPGSPFPQKRLDVPHLIHCKTSQYIIVNKYIFQNYLHFLIYSQKDCPGIRNLILLHRVVVWRFQIIHPSARQYTEVRVEVLVGVLAEVRIEFRTLFHIDKGTEFTNRLFQRFLKDKDILLFTTHNDTSVYCWTTQSNA